MNWYNYFENNLALSSKAMINMLQYREQFAWESLDYPVKNSWSSKSYRIQIWELQIWEQLFSEHKQQACWNECLVSQRIIWRKPYYCRNDHMVWVFKTYPIRVICGLCCHFYSCSGFWVYVCSLLVGCLHSSICLSRYLPSTQFNQFKLRKS